MNEIVTRTWGTYEVLAEGSNWKLKRLIVNPNSKSSLQRHFKRSEIWFFPNISEVIFHKVTEWHQLINTGDKPLEIIELQFGEACEEIDIERKEEK